VTASSSAGGIRVDLPIPRGWAILSLPPPSLASAEEVHILQWQAWAPASPEGAPTGSSALVAACMAADTSSWTPEAEPIVLERLGAVVSSTALRVARVGERRVASAEHTGTSTTERIEGTGDAAGQIAARTFLGFVDAGDGAAGLLVGCFALCTKDLAACGPSVEHATVAAEFVPAPRPTLAVRAVVVMAHHPSITAFSALIFALLAGVVAVVTRRRPRTK
jgi:hypothetical protein